MRSEKNDIWFNKIGTCPRRSGDGPSQKFLLLFSGEGALSCAGRFTKSGGSEVD